MSITRVRWLRPEDNNARLPIAHAARQLSRYSEKITGQELAIRASRKVRDTAGTAWLGICDQMPEPPSGALTSDQWDDGFAIWADKGQLYIAGRNGRSVLFGVYAYLESQGVRFLRPGPSGEVVPSLKELTLPAEPIKETPRYRHRGLCIEGAPSIGHALSTVDWAAKNRFNTVFLQFFSSRYFYNRWYEHLYNPLYRGHNVSDAQALALDERIIKAMKRCGIIFHRVGHSWTSAAFDMPRSGWVTADDSEIPEEFAHFPAELNGERKLFGGIPINTEICYSHKPAFDRFVDKIVEYSAEHPEIDVVHVWLSDAPNNKCECEGCRELNISDWYAKVINALSEELTKRSPNTRFVFLCYFELLWAPEKVEIKDSNHKAIMMFAPISRCYAHGLNDADCRDDEDWQRPELNQFRASRRNAYFVDRLQAWRKAFQGDSFDFDYHLMWANWYQCTDTLVAQVIYEDLQHLKDMELDGIVSCQSFRNFYPSGLAMAALGRGLWDPSTPWEEFRLQYLGEAFGPNVAFADAYFAETQELVATDEHRTVPPFSDKDPAGLAAADEYLKGALDEVAQLIKAEGDPLYRRSLELIQHHAEFLRLLITVYQVRAAGKPALSNLEVDRAAQFLRRTEAKMHPYMDTELALRCSVEWHRVAQ